MAGDQRSLVMKGNKEMDHYLKRYIGISVLKFDTHAQICATEAY